MEETKSHMYNYVSRAYSSSVLSWRSVLWCSVRSRRTDEARLIPWTPALIWCANKHWNFTRNPFHLDMWLRPECVPNAIRVSVWKCSVFFCMAWSIRQCRAAATCELEHYKNCTSNGLVLRIVRCPNKRTWYHINWLTCWFDVTPCWRRGDIYGSVSAPRWIFSAVATPQDEVMQKPCWNFKASDKGFDDCIIFKVFT